jgi:predicted secreted hydrolase
MSDSPAASRLAHGLFEEALSSKKRMAELLAAAKRVMPKDFDQYPPDDFAPEWHALRAAIAEAEGQSTTKPPSDK